MEEDDSDGKGPKVTVTPSPHGMSQSIQICLH